MKLSKITPAVAAQYVRLNYAEMTAADKIELDAFIVAAKEYVKSYTGLADTDAFEDLAIAGLVLIQDMYDNRSLTVEQAAANKTVATILDMHRVNLL